MDADRPRRRFGGRVRQQQGIQPHGERGGGGNQQRLGRRFDSQPADEQAGGDPADGAEHADLRKVARRILDVVERQRVGQRQRRHVAEGVAEQHQVQAAERRQRRCVVEQSGADKVQHCEDLLGREEPVGDHPDKKR